MCGIAGVVALKPEEVVHHDHVRRMIEPIEHRGPDDHGIFTDGTIGLGFRRLSIIDLSPLGHQPMSSVDGNVWIVFNGEIYNYRPLKKKCEEMGYVFRGRSDTEVIIALYSLMGDRCIEQLRGMFGLAIWDKQKKQLLVARDRIGKKPLYYSSDGRRLLFGSEMKSILAMDNISREIDGHALHEYFSYGFISAPSTIHAGIKKLRPGHYLLVRDGSYTEHPYWELRPSTPTQVSEEEVMHTLKEKISEAVRIRLESDVPLGAFLSGGIDSSLVVAFMAQYSSEPVRTYSVGFKESDFDESPFARDVASRFGTRHTEEIVSPDYAGLIEKIVLDFDEPFGDSSALPTYIVSKLTRQHVTVALSGDGGDELFGGYDHYSIALRERSFDRIPAIMKPLLRLGSTILPDTVPGGNALFRASLNDPRRRFVERRRTFYHYDLKRLFTKEGMHRALGFDPTAAQLKWFETAQQSDFLTQCQYNDFKYVMVDDILVKVDRMSMLNSLEVRSPLLDHELAEYAFRLPSTLVIKNGEKKYLLKKLLSEFLPSELVYRRKQGFSLPLRQWFANDLYAFTYDHLHSSAMITSGLFRMETIDRLMKTHRSGRRDLSFHLWFLLAFSIWINKNRIA